MVDDLFAIHVTNKRPYKVLKKLTVFLVCIVFSLLSTVLTLRADLLKPQRGDFPKCQETCLAVHRTKMETTINDYVRLQDKISFQDSVDKALIQYKDCIDNCRDPMPVK
jgi:hypothetical protein